MHEPAMGRRGMAEAKRGRKEVMQEIGGDNGDAGGAWGCEGAIWKDRGSGLGQGAVSCLILWWEAGGATGYRF